MAIQRTRWYAPGAHRPECPHHFLPSGISASCPAWWGRVRSAPGNLGGVEFLHWAEGSWSCPFWFASDSLVLQKMRTLQYLQTLEMYFLVIRQWYLLIEGSSPSSSSSSIVSSAPGNLGGVVNSIIDGNAESSTLFDYALRQASCFVLAPRSVFFHYVPWIPSLHRPSPSCLKYFIMAIVINLTIYLQFN